MTGVRNNTIDYNEPRIRIGVITKKLQYFVRVSIGPVMENLLEQVDGRIAAWLRRKEVMT